MSRTDIISKKKKTRRNIQPEIHQEFAEKLHLFYRHSSVKRRPAGLLEFASHEARVGVARQPGVRCTGSTAGVTIMQSQCCSSATVAGPARATRGGLRVHRTAYLDIRVHTSKMCALPHVLANALES
jgi:hypothetical protein